MASPIFIQEEYVDASDSEKMYRLGSSDVYETDYTTDEIGRLYHSLQKMYGRCVSKVYVDRRDGESRAIGWVFHKRVAYDHCYKSSDTYLREVWVTLYSGKPTTVYAEPIVIG
jgi:hypothetical protein